MKVSILNLWQKMKMTQKQPKSGGSPVSINPLLIIAVVFAASFAGRAVGIANAALNKPAEAETDAVPQSDIAPPTQLMPAADEDDAHSDKTAHSAEPTHGPTPVAATDTHQVKKPASAVHENAQYTELMAAIRERSNTLDNKSIQIEDRIRTLEILEARIEEKLTQLKESNSELSQLVSYANEASKEDISMLATMYEQMKPARAGEIFDKMNATFAAGFLTEMNSENAAAILTNMNTEKAYEASMIIASRNAAVHQ